MNKQVVFSYLLLVLILGKCIWAFSADGGAERGAGGGGDPLLAIIKAQKSRAQLRPEDSKDFQLGNLKTMFCEMTAGGIKKITNLSSEQMDLAINKVREICLNPNQIENIPNLKLEDGEQVSAMNWPEASRLAFDERRIESILKTFDSETRILLLDVLFVHEALSLVKLEGVFHAD